MQKLWDKSWATEQRPLLFAVQGCLDIVRLRLQLVSSEDEQLWIFLINILLRLVIVADGFGPNELANLTFWNTLP
jgi:hypothetical protein